MQIDFGETLVSIGGVPVRVYFFVAVPVGAAVGGHRSGVGFAEGSTVGRDRPCFNGLVTGRRFDADDIALSLTIKRVHYETVETTRVRRPPPSAGEQRVCRHAFATHDGNRGTR
jgi:hypothetical protein